MKFRSKRKYKKLPKAPTLLNQPAPRATREEKDERIDEIIDMMTNGLWITGKSHIELAKKWNVSSQTVYNYAIDASRIIVRLSKSDFSEEEQKDLLMSGLDGLRARALSSNGRPDLRTALKTYELTARLKGFLSNKHEVKVEEIEELDNLPPEELAQLLEEEAKNLKKISKK